MPPVTTIGTVFNLEPRRLTMTREGFWAVFSKGAAGEGVGMMVLDTNMVVGADAGGIVYDGHYTRNNSNELLCEVVAHVVKPLSWVVTTGQHIPVGTKFLVKATLPSNPASDTAVTVKTPLGDFLMTFRKIRDFPPGS